MRVSDILPVIVTIAGLLLGSVAMGLVYVPAGLAAGGLSLVYLGWRFQGGDSR